MSLTTARLPFQDKAVFIVEAASCSDGDDGGNDQPKVRTAATQTEGPSDVVTLRPSITPTPVQLQQCAPSLPQQRAPSLPTNLPTYQFDAYKLFRAMGVVSDSGMTLRQITSVVL